MDYMKELVDRSDILLGIAVFLCSAAYILLQKPKHKLPPGPTGLPIVGYLPFLGKDPHLTLYQLSKKYGDVFGLKMGGTYVVVLTDLIIARELFNNPSTAKRSPHVFHLMPDNVGLASLSGPEWQEQRRFTIMQMKNLGFGQSFWEEMIQAEIQSLLEHISKSGGQPIDIYPQLTEILCNNILSLATGRPVQEGDAHGKIIDRGIDSFTDVHTQSNILAFYPRIFRIAAKWGLLKIRKNIKEMVEMNKYIRSTIRELKQEEGHSYIHVYLKEIEKSRASSLRRYFNESNLAGNLQALIIGGVDTTKISLQWLFLAMAAFPDFQDKVHQELDSVLGKEQPANWDDRQRLPYCQATILEGQRWRTVVPLNLLHSTTENTMAGEYVIPKDSDVMALTWVFHNDPRHWRDPEVFRPERFLGEGGKVVKKLGNFAPFSIGKRACIGESIANIEIFLFFVRIMQKFRILPAIDNISPNLEGSLGILFKPERQELRFIPR